MTISDGGRVEVADTLKILERGSVTIDGGTLQTDTLDNQVGGTLTVVSGELMVVDMIGDLLIDGGVYAPGASPALSTITGDYTQGALGTLEIELAGLAAGTEYDVLDISGSASLGGTLDVALLGSFIPTIDDAFTFMIARDGFERDINDNIISFDTLLQPILSGGFFKLVFGTDSLTGYDYAQLLFSGTDVSAVPLPPSAWMFLSGLFGIGFVRRRRRLAAVARI